MACVQHAIKLCRECYGAQAASAPSSFRMLRMALLAFFQDKKVKVRQ